MIGPARGAAVRASRARSSAGTARAVLPGTALPSARSETCVGMPTRASETDRSRLRWRAPAKASTRGAGRRRRRAAGAAQHDSPAKLTHPGAPPESHRRRRFRMCEQDLPPALVLGSARTSTHPHPHPHPHQHPDMRLLMCNNRPFSKVGFEPHAQEALQQVCYMSTSKPTPSRSRYLFIIKRHCTNTHTRTQVLR